MNSDFSICDAGLEGVKIITPFYREDNRGYFLKSMKRDVYLAFGLEVDIDEIFESYSKKNVIRGLHFQSENAQIKIVRAINGTIYDVVVDLRYDSPTFGKWTGVELSDQNHISLWIPAGFAHGYKVLSEDAYISYQCIGKYMEEFDTGIRYDDPDLAINWNAADVVIVSEKDAKLQSFKDYCKNCKEKILSERSGL